MQAHGYNIVRVQQAFFEGGNFIYDPEEKILFAGVGLRHQEPEMLAKLRSELSAHIKPAMRIVPVPNDEYYYHTDIAMSEMLPDKRFLVSKQWQGYNIVKDYLGLERLIGIGEHEATHGVCNIAIANGILFMTSCPPSLRARLKEAGFVVNAPDDAMAAQPKRLIGPPIGGGGVHCMTIRVRTHWL